jgi:hypothetical protein
MPYLFFLSSIRSSTVPRADIPSFALVIKSSIQHTCMVDNNTRSDTSVSKRMSSDKCLSPRWSVASKEVFYTESPF